MIRLLLWIGDLFERFVPDDGWDCDSFCHRASQWFYRIAWRLLGGD